ncbi:MAG: FecR domain-containing protein [Pseudomonadota bacterium]
MTSPDVEERRNILRTAHDWRHRMGRLQTSRAEREAFDDWLAADPRHAELYDRAVTFYEAMGALEADDLGPRVLRQTARERWYLFKVRMASLLAPLTSRSGVAAAGLAGVAVFGLVLIVAIFYVANPPASDLAITAQYETAIGETREFSLPDGTVVTLGAASAVETAFAGDARTATLTAGAAVFDVASDAQRPFTVEAGDLRAKVLGTVFDVTRSGDLVRVGVAEGRVEVRYPVVVGDAAIGVTARKDVAAGEQIAARASEGLGDVLNVNVDTVGAWRNNTLYYQGERLSDLVADANRYSEDRVVIEGDVALVSNYRVQGSFKADDIDGMLTVLSEVYPVTIDRSKEGVIAIRSK